MVTNGRSALQIELSRRTATGSSDSSRAIASIVPSMIHDALAIGARIGPAGHFVVRNTDTS